MKWFGFISSAIFFALSACGLEEIEEVNKDKYQGIIANEFQSYQIRFFSPGPLDDIILSVDGELGGVPIKAGKTEMNEIVFVVPDLPAGSYQLKLEIGDETRIWDARVGDQAIEVDEIAAFWSAYFLGSDVIYDSLKNYPRLDYFAKEAAEWSKYFETLFEGLSQNEKNELIYLIYRNGFERYIPFSFEVTGDFENCLEENFAVYALNSFEEGWYQKELKMRIPYLPSSKIKEAFLAFMGDLIWRHSAVEEFLAPKVVACTILKDVKLETKWGPVGTDPIILNSGESLGFKLTGVYSKLNSLAGSSEVEGVAHKVAYFDIAKNQRVTDADFISSIIQTKRLDLPYLSRVPFFSLPIQVQEVSKSLFDYNAEISSISNPDIVLSEKSQNEDLLWLTFENEKAGNQDFQFEITLKHSGFTLSKSVNANMPEISELILDLSFDSGTAFLQILSGNEPFEILWSNGVRNDAQVRFSSGNHSVKVRDENGNEKMIEFIIPEFGTVKDRDGNEYQTIKIGDRWWMAENLRTITRKDGRVIQGSSIWPSWNPSFDPNFDLARYSFYENNPGNDKRYGKLYNIHSFGGCLCPEGWQMPTFMDFTELAEELGGLPEAARKLKSRSNWKETIFNSTNESGFNAKPGGMKYNNDSYQDEEKFVGWWAVGGNLPDRIAYLEAGSNELKMINRTTFYFEGHYIRCVKKE